MVTVFLLGASGYLGGTCQLNSGSERDRFVFRGYSR